MGIYRKLMSYGTLGVIGAAALIAGKFMAFDNRSENRGERIVQQIEQAQNQTDQKASVPLPIMPRSRSAGTGYLTQINTSFLAYWNGDDMFIDQMKLNGYPDDWRWLFSFRDRNWNTREAEAAGFIDPVSGDMTSVPPGLIVLQSPTLLFGYTDFPAYYGGDWVITWDGDATPQLGASIAAKGVRIVDFDRGRNRLVLSVPVSGAEPFRLNFSDIRTPIQNFKMVRLDDEAKHAAGQLWNPDFLEYMRGYDVIRPMTTQGINTSPVRRWSDVVTPDDPNIFEREPALTIEQRPRNGRYGVPYEYLLNLAVEADAQLWLHVPIQIGSPVSHLDLPDIQQIMETARRNSRDILNSPHWDEFAKELVARIEASDYPVDRPLYVELGNEVWNYAWPFFIATRYAEGIAKGVKADEGLRYGYGLLSARLIMAMETALAGTDHQVTYVIASQTAVPDTTDAAYRGLQDFWRTQKLDVATLTSKTAIALTTYHGGADAYRELVEPRPNEALIAAWEREINRDPEALEIRLHDRYTQGGSQILFGKAWLLARWAEHKEIADRYGVRLIGAYEGGSHDNPPEEFATSEIFMNWWTDYHWGPRGADVVRQINQAIIDTYPGVMLSNFVAHGKVGEWRAPWNDGHYTNETAMSQMWEEFERANREASPR